MLFFAHLSNFDFNGAIHLINRASLRYNAQSTAFFKAFIPVVELMQARNHEGTAESISTILKKNKDVGLSDLLSFTLNMQVYYHVPSALRLSFETIAKAKLDKILSFGTLKGIKVSQLGFSETKDKKFYVIDKLFDHKDIGGFELTEDRVNKLTTVVKFLEHQNYNLTEKDIPPRKEKKEETDAKPKTGKDVSAVKGKK